MTVIFSVLTIKGLEKQKKLIMTSPQYVTVDGQNVAKSVSLSFSYRCSRNSYICWSSITTEQVKVKTACSFIAARFASLPLRCLFPPLFFYCWPNE